MIKKVFNIPIIISATSLLLVLLLTATYTYTHPSSLFNLQFNGYAMISLISFFIYLMIFWKVIYGKYKADEVKWYLVYVFGGLVFSFSEFLWRSSTHRLGALLWSQINLVGAALIPVGFIMFVIAYSNEKKYSKEYIIFPVLLAWGAVAFYTGFGRVLDVSNLSKFILRPWGWFNNDIIGYDYYLVWFLVLFTSGLYILYKVYQQSTNEYIKKQSFWFLLSFSIPLILGLFTDGLLPALNVYVLPPLGSVFGTLAVYLTFYGLKKYSFFQITPELFSDNVLDTMSEAVIVTDKDFKIESINNEAKRILALNQGDYKNHHLTDFFNATVWQKITNIINNTEQQVTIGDIKLANQDNHLIPVRVRATELYENNNFLAFVFVIGDITDITRSYNNLKQLEEQLRYEKENVEHIVELRTKQLKTAQEQLLEDDLMKSEFIALASHHLRTPITVIDGYSEMLQTLELNETQKKYFEGLNNGITRLKRLIEELLFISNLESGKKLPFQHYSIAELIAPTVESIKQLTTEKKLNFIITGDYADILIDTDKKSFEMVISNLLDNAVKYTASGVIELNINSVDKKLLHLEIKDSGRGIPKIELNTIFTKFHRGRGEMESEYQGVGLSLFMTKLIIETYGGNISVNSVEGTGTEFKISLPLKQY